MIYICSAHTIRTNHMKTQKGRLLKKLGSVVQDFKEKCNEIDGQKQQAREGQPTGKEMISAAMLDLKAQIDEYEKIVSVQKGNGDKKK